VITFEDGLPALALMLAERSLEHRDRPSAERAVIGVGSFLNPRVQTRRDP